MSLARQIKRQFERKSRKRDMGDLYSRVDVVQNQVSARYQAKEEERTMYTFSFVLAMCCRVLVHEFGWGKLPKDRDADERFRLVRFARAVSEEINRFDATRKDAVERYCDEVYQDIGVRFEYK